jgi:serine protease
VAPATAEVEASSVWGGSPSAELILLAAADRMNTALSLENQRSRAQALSDCINTVILIEMQSELIGQSYAFPVEIYYDTFAVIKLITGAGVTVIEPAGNGSTRERSEADGQRNQPPAVDLDSLEALIQPVTGLPQNLRSLNPEQSSDLPALAPNIALAAFADSGAIIVSAAVGSRHAAPIWSREFNANFGRRVNCFAQGADVATLTFDPNNADARTRKFAGTSAASAIIAGAALCVQGMAQASGLGSLLAPDMRELLANSETGTRAKDPSKSKIGVMPNLKHAKSQIDRLAALGRLVRPRSVP